MTPYPLVLDQLRRLDRRVQLDSVVDALTRRWRQVMYRALG